MRPDFNRDIHCVLGLPFDAKNMPDLVLQIKKAAADRSPCFLSTPNLNFLIACQSDMAFRNSVIHSDISIADGMPIVWLARLLGIPIRERLAGSSLFDQLRAEKSSRLSVYFFGGLEGVAETACHRLNAEPSGLMCVGYESPGFASIQKMSSTETITKINASGADFLVVSLGAKKGQAWIELNRTLITVPVISHLGAVVNFVAGTLDRAPRWLQRSGFEWLWRIKEEPSLWSRYTSDGWILVKLLVGRVIPYVWFMYQHKPENQNPDSATIELFENEKEILVRLSGAWQQKNLKPLRQCFTNLALGEKDIQLDLERVTYVDSAFIGLLILLYGDRTQQGTRLFVCKHNKRVLQIFRYSCAEFLLG